MSNKKQVLKSDNHLPLHRPSCHFELCCWDPEVTRSLEMRTAASEDKMKNWVLVLWAALLLVLKLKKQHSRQTVSIIHLIKVYNSHNETATPFHKSKKQRFCSLRLKA